MNTVAMLKAASSRLGIGPHEAMKVPSPLSKDTDVPRAAPGADQKEMVWRIFWVFLSIIQEIFL